MATALAMENLCERIHKAQTRNAALSYGIIRDGQLHKSWSFGVYPMARAEDQPAVSLRQILEHPSQFPRLTYRDKLQLAVIMSSSLLQLHQTPWLPDLVSSRDIYFFARDTTAPLYGCAYVVRGLPECIPEAKGGDSSRLGPQCNPTLLSLGIVLIELLLGKTLDSMGRDDEALSAGAPSLLQDFVTAQRLLPEVRQGSRNYGSAVQRCIYGDFSGQTLDLTDEDFRQEVYSKVVAMLEADLENA